MTERRRPSPLLLLPLLIVAGGVWFLAAPGGCRGGSDPGVVAYDERGWSVEAAQRPVERRLNLILLVVDTLRADCLPDDAGSPPLMPGLAALAQRGARLRAVSAPAPWTFPSMASLLTGLLPDQHRIDQGPEIPLLPPGVATYAEILQASFGYETAAITELDLGDPTETLFQGFAWTRAGGPLRFARPEVTRWNEQRDRRSPFFLLLHTYEAHDPYGEENHPWPKRHPTRRDFADVPAVASLDDKALVEGFLLDHVQHTTWLKREPALALGRVFDYFGRGFAAAPDPELAARLETAYRAGVGWVDREIEVTIRHLESEGLLEDTVLIVTSDHGEAFGEHGVLNHGRTLHEEHLHVPCVILGPEPFRGGRVLDTSIGLVDLLPTFLHLCGMPAPGGVAGRPMLTALQANAPGRAVQGREVLTPFKTGQLEFGDTTSFSASARTGTASYLVTYELTSGRITEQLFDRSRDPGEGDDRAVRGRIGGTPVDASLAQGIEEARAFLWEIREAARTRQARREGRAAGAPPPRLPALVVSGK